MCGIAGLYSPSIPLRTMGNAAEIVRNMTQSFVHRGPDADGLWADQRQRCALGHRRLSIIDISDAGRQPMTSADGRWVISFNGEIYNFQDIRRELQAKSVALRGRTDTEVLLESIALWGVEALPKLDGMYAFAAFDALTGELLLARDPFGEKPLYYMELAGGGLAFASELQAFESVPGFDATISADALAEVLMFQYIGASRSIYQGVQKLPPGHWMRLVPGRAPEIKRYFTFEPGAKGYTNRPMAQLADELEEILVRSLERRLVADVPLGAFLSGGVDSSTVCALARRKLGVPLKTFSIGFAGDKESEHEIARQFAAHLGTEHHDKIISPSAVDFLNHAGALLDEPNADSSCLPTYYLSEFARQHVTVALSGDGGDELFGGYGRYFQTLKDVEADENQRMATWSPGRSYYYSNRIMVFSPEQLAQLFGFIPGGSAEHVKRLMNEVDYEGVPLLHRLRSSDVENYMPGAVLPKVDRMSMRHSLEVRTPFLNMELARFAERLPAHYLVGEGRGKLLLREIAYRYLPREIIDLPKKGFGLPLTADWGKSQLVSALRDSLGEDSPLGDWFGADRAQKFVNLQASENGFSIYQTWSVIMLDKWLRNRPAKLPDIESISVVPQKNVANFYLAGAATRVRMMGFIEPSVLVVSSPSHDEADEAADIVKQLGNDDYSLLRALVKRGLLGLKAEGVNNPSRTYILDPGWNISKCLQEFHIDVADCTIISLDSDDQWIDLSGIQDLRAKRLRRLVLPARHSSNGVWVSYDFNHSNPFKRALNILRLLPYASGLWRVKCCPTGLDGGHQTKSLERLETEKDRESSLDFALFAGPGQYVPYVSSHQEIADSGGRRYSIWNQEAYYSVPVQPRPWYLRHFYSFNWVVPVNEITSPLLPVAAKRIDIYADQPSLADTLNSLVNKTNQVLLPEREPNFIVLYTHGLSAGGAERQWCNLAIGLKDVGKRVCLVVDSYAGHNGHYLEMVRSAGVEVLQSVDEKEYRISTIEDETIFGLFDSSILPVAANMSRLATVLDRLKPDALVAQLDSSNITGVIAALLLNIPQVVMSFRNYNPSHFHYLDQPWFLPAYQALAGSNRVVLTGNSRLGNLDYAEWMGIDADRIHLLKNAYQPDSSELLSDDEKQEFRDSLGIDPEKKIVFGAFRLSKEKNPKLFVDTCARVLRHHPDVIALLCGEGAMRADLEMSIAQAGLSDRILLLGRRSDVWMFLCIADVLLLTSDKEGTPNIVREALMHRCPVVSTACGAVPEMIEEGVNGHVVPLGDTQALATCVERVLFDANHKSNLIQHIAGNQDSFSPMDKASLLLNILRGHNGHV